MQFQALYAQYWNRHAKIRLKCPDNVKYFWRAHGDQWRDLHVEDINHQHMQAWFDHLALKSKSSAVRAVDSLSAIINWGLKRGLITLPNGNPCCRVEKVKLTARERFLLPDEIVRFKESLAQEPRDTQDFFWLCLLTGARRGNVQAMEWVEIDTTLEQWRIPPEKHKNGKSHLIPLTSPALAILDRRHASTNSAYVFPGKGKTGHLVEPKRAWKRILKRANISDMRIHDLRRTLGSYLAIQGESQYVIGKALGHIDQRSTAVYARLYLAPIRKAMEQTAETMLHRSGGQ